jgi:hypothetical protein
MLGPQLAQLGLDLADAALVDQLLQRFGQGHQWSSRLCRQMVNYAILPRIGGAENFIPDDIWMSDQQLLIDPGPHRLAREVVFLMAQFLIMAAASSAIWGMIAGMAGESEESHTL